MKFSSKLVVILSGSQCMESILNCQPSIYNNTMSHSRLPAFSHMHKCDLRTCTLVIMPSDMATATIVFSLHGAVSLQLLSVQCLLSYSCPIQHVHNVAWKPNMRWQFPSILCWWPLTFSGCCYQHKGESPATGPYFYMKSCLWVTKIRLPL